MGYMYGLQPRKGWHHSMQWRWPEEGDDCPRTSFFSVHASCCYVSGHESFVPFSVPSHFCVAPCAPMNCTVESCKNLVSDGTWRQ